MLDLSLGMTQHFNLFVAMIQPLFPYFEAQRMFLNSKLLETETRFLLGSPKIIDNLFFRTCVRDTLATFIYLFIIIIIIIIIMIIIIIPLINLNFLRNLTMLISYNSIRKVNN
jgi:hypothetical protein